MLFRTSLSLVLYFHKSFDEYPSYFKISGSKEENTASLQVCSCGLMLYISPSSGTEVCACYLSESTSGNNDQLIKKIKNTRRYSFFYFLLKN